jgi:predicted nucleic acid-binding protein
VSYLLDTSVVTRLRHPAVRSRVEGLDAVGVARSPMTDLEIGFSASSGSDWDQLMTALEAFALVEIEPSHFDRARKVQRLLAVRGLRGRRVPNLLLAAVAEGTARTVIHYDTASTTSPPSPARRRSGSLPERRSTDER